MSPLVFIHEMGHYLMGRWCGVKAEAFSIGFGRSLARWTDKRGTEWRIGWLPIGGYVKFAGDMSVVGGDNDEWLKLSPAERNQTFQSKKLWQRALIVFAGPLTNFLLAIAMLAALFGVYGEPRIAPVVGAFAPNSVAKSAGMRVGDRIIAIEGEVIQKFDDIALIIQARAAKPTAITVEREGGRRAELTVTPQLEQVADMTGVKLPMGRIGVAPARAERIKLSISELPGAGVRFTLDSVRMSLRAMGQIIIGDRSVKELGGPVKIATTSNAVAQLGVVSFLFFMAMISINLGFINLLPIPMLDGGHLAFYAAEAIRGKPVSAGTQEWAYRTGFTALLGFMMLVTVNDLAGLGLFNGLSGLIG
jgi:regulator of sigma E protease